MTDQVTDTHNPTPAAEPLALRLSEWLGAWCGKLTHRHAYRQRKNWAMLDGQLICLRVTDCPECGHVHERALLLIASAAELAEANAKQMASP